MAEDDRPDRPAADGDAVDELSAEVSQQAPDDGAERLAEESTETIVEVLQQVNPSTAQDLLASLPEERQQEVLAAAPESSRQWALNQTFPEGSVGRLMDPPIGVFSPEMTVGEAVEELRELVKGAFITYAFVVDAQGTLVGVVVMRDLLFADRGQRLSDIMLRDPFSLTPQMPLRDAMRLVLNRHYPVYPVCDGGRLVGLVRGGVLFQEQAIEISAQPGAMVGVEKEERLSTPWPTSLKYRHPWLQLNLLTAFVAAGVVGAFQKTIDELVILAVFLPVLAGQSGNTGCQALAVALRGMTLGELRPGRERALVHEGRAARPAERSAGRRHRRHRDVRGRAGAGQPERAHPRVRGPAGHDRQLRGERAVRRAHPAHLEEARRRSRHRVEHLPHHRHRRGEHGPVPDPRHGPRALDRHSDGPAGADGVGG